MLEGGLLHGFLRGGGVRVAGEGVDVDLFRHGKSVVSGIDARGRAGGVDEADGEKSRRSRRHHRAYARRC